jgi:hypothetical protein
MSRQGAARGRTHGARTRETQRVSALLSNIESVLLRGSDVGVDTCQTHAAPEHVLRWASQMEFRDWV